MRQGGQTESGWQDAEMSGRAVQVARDRDGDLVGKFARHTFEQPHEDDTGATTPYPGREGWVIDWFWPALCAVAVLMFVCMLVGI